VPRGPDGARPLLPVRPAVLCDREHLVPLAANLAAEYPRETALLVADRLVPLESAAAGGPA
jgi:hypothetical protein